MLLFLLLFSWLSVLGQPWLMVLHLLLVLQATATSSQNHKGAVACTTTPSISYSYSHSPFSAYLAQMPLYLAKKPRIKKTFQDNPECVTSELSPINAAIAVLTVLCQTLLQSVHGCHNWERPRWPSCH